MNNFLLNKTCVIFFLFMFIIYYTNSFRVVRHSQSDTKTERKSTNELLKKEILLKQEKYKNQTIKFRLKQPPETEVIDKVNEEQTEPEILINIENKTAEVKDEMEKRNESEIEEKVVIPKQNKTKSDEIKKKSKKQSQKLVNATSKKNITKSKTKSEINKSIPISQYNNSVINLLFHFPTFVPNSEVIKSSECKNQVKLLISQLNEYKLWALKMLDSSAKLPSGILRGNLNQFGDYDQCINTYAKITINESNSVRITGKYCLATIDLDAKIQTMKLPVHLAQGRAMLRSKNSDFGHFLPRFTTIRWAVCVPASCTSDDVENILIDSLQFYNETFGLEFHVNVNSNQCSVKKTGQKIVEHNLYTIATICLLMLISVVVFIATIRDYQTFVPERNEEVEDECESRMEQVFMSFSLKRNSVALLQFNSDCESKELECVYGLRAITTLALYFIHKVMVLAHAPINNRIVLTEFSNHPLSILFRLPFIYGDSLLLLSGVLTAYRMSKDIESKDHIPWFKRIVARLLRLTPTLIMVLLYYCHLMEYIGDGPLWNSLILPNTQLCRQYWWRNLLFIQNLFPFQEMCAPHSYQLALDMQLYLIAPILVWLLYRRPLLGVFTTILLHSVSVVIRYYTTLNLRLSFILYHGISLNQMFRTANSLYTSSLYRATPFLTGVGLGVLLCQLKPNFQLPRILNVIGWIIALYFAIWTFYTPAHLVKRYYQYDVNEAAQYAALCSVSWALALSWLIFSCFADNNGFINTILSSRPVIIFSRISYTFYLVQFAVLFYNVASLRSTTEFKFNLSSEFMELITIIFLSVLISFLVDLPAQNIKMILLHTTTTTTSQDDSEISSDYEINTQKWSNGK